MLNAEAQAEKPGRYLAQLCWHTSQMCERPRAEAADEENLTRIQDLLTATLNHSPGMPA